MREVVVGARDEYAGFAVGSEESVEVEVEVNVEVEEGVTEDVVLTIESADDMEDMVAVVFVGCRCEFGYGCEKTL